MESDSGIRIENATRIAIEFGHQPGAWERMPFTTSEMMRSMCTNCGQHLYVRLGDTHGVGKYSMTSVCDPASVLVGTESGFKNHGE